MISHRLFSVLCLGLLSDGAHAGSVRCGSAGLSVRVRAGEEEIGLPCVFAHIGLSDMLLVWQVEARGPVLSTNGSREFKVWDPDFRGRVRVDPDWYRKGNAELRVTRPRVSDSGNYSCIVRAEGPAEYCARVTLDVNSAGSCRCPGLTAGWIAAPPLLLLLLPWAGLLL